jgi:hypothetical protein
VLRRGRLLGEKIPDPGADARECAEVETREPDLDRPRIVVPCVRRKVRVQPLGQRCESLDALWPIEESGGPGDDQVTGYRPASISSISCLSAFSPFSRVSARIRWSVSTSSSTSTRPARPESRSITRSPARKCIAPNASRSPFTPAERFTAAATFGWPLIQAMRPSANAL